MIAALTLLMALQTPTQDKVDFMHIASNLKFQHPVSWQVKKVKDDFQISIPLKGAKDTARLDIFAVSFMADPEVWENSQRYFAEQLKQTIKGKSREELLGVPLLLYKLQETETPARKITLSGLVYAATEYKMQFRLTAPESSFEEAEYEFRQVLQSFSTVDGKLPEPERPGRATEAPATGKKPFRVPEKTTTALGNTSKPEPIKIVIGPSKFETVVAGKAVELCAPEGWSFEKGTNGVVTAKYANLQGSLEIDMHSSLDSPKLSVALIRKAATLLDEFTVVKRREETKPTDTTAGAKSTRILRFGVGKSGDFTQVLAGAEKGEFYWTLVFRSAGAISPETLKSIDAFVNGASIERKP